MSTLTRILLAILALALAGPATPAAEEEKEIVWSLSAEFRARPEYRDNLDLQSSEDDETRLVPLRLRLGVDVTWRKELRVFAQVQDSRVAGEEMTTASNEENLDLHQGYVELTPAGWKGLSIQAGRQEWSYGDQRMIGAFAWDNIGRAFDGARIRWRRSRFTLDGLAARVTSRVTAVSASTISAPEIGSSESTGSDLYGLYARWAPASGGEIDLYWLEFADHAVTPGEQTGTSGSTRIDALGVRFKRSAGRFDFLFEGAAESGEVSADDLSATAAAAEAGWTVGEDVATRFFAGYDYASGDEDPTDGEREEFFNFFPTNHPLYGYADMFGWRNIRSPHAGVSVKSGRHFGLIRGYLFDLDSEAGPWKNAGGGILGFDATGESGRRVGSEIDLLYRFALMEKVSLEGGFARFEPGAFAEETRGGSASSWGYAMLTAGF